MEKGKFQWWGDGAPCWKWGALCSPASPDHLFQPCFPHRSGDDYKWFFPHVGVVVNILNETITEGKVTFAVDGQNNATWHAINVFGIVAYNNPNLDYISITKMPQPGYTDRLEDDTLSNKRYSAAWEKISLISILIFLQPSETFFIYVTLVYLFIQSTARLPVSNHLTSQM